MKAVNAAVHRKIVRNDQVAKAIVESEEGRLLWSPNVQPVDTTNPDLVGADRIHTIHRMSRRQRRGEGETQGGQLPTRDRGCAKKTPRRTAYRAKYLGRDSEAGGSRIGMHGVLTCKCLDCIRLQSSN